MSTLNVIGLVTSDLPASLAFYRILGVPVPDAPADAPHAEAVLPGGLRLAWDPVSTIRSFDPDYTPPGGHHRIALAFQQDTPEQVDAVFARLVDAGHPGHIEPWDAPWGQRYATVLDPDGNAVDLYAPLPGAG